MGETADTSEAARERRAAFINKRRQTMGGIGPFLVEVNGRYRFFEFNGICGPVLLDKDGEPLKKQPGDNSDFWPAFYAWRDAGCHIDQHNRAFVPSARVLGKG